ncbi:methyl-accepting chemotaxis protein [Archangium gephyra]|uniref:Methyl-accepting chemotaxis protein n=1 Tax=Archangium gephyra TaxID=48 RepID=A0AAC8Q3E6_9BACT|nr:methyl-accepting chemotaxis protein [Archangium gephyra]AKJ00224.1 Methyl accepting chemotaxis protein [Archangium gephyra]REG33077.1 methyl-accepting chemotaxis protein [Archangium gephyra]
MRLPLIGTLKLRGRLTLYVTLLAVAPLLLSTWAGVSTTQEMMQAQVHEMLRIEAEGLKDLVEASLAERETSVRSWADDALLRESLQRDTYALSDGVLSRLQLRYTTFTGLVLFTDDGRAVSASTPALRDSFAGQEAAVRDAAWFKAAQQGRFTSTTLTQEDPVFGMQVLHLAAPVMEARGGRRLGVLLAAYDWGQVGEVVKAALARARSRKNESFALEVRTASGTVLFDSRGKDAWNIPNAVAEQAINGPEIPDVGDGWRFVALSDPEEVYATMHKLRAGTAVAVMAVVALAALAALLLSRGITAPITRLSQVVRRIVQEGDLTQKPDVRSDDEVGELARSFVQLVDHLRETTESLQRGTQVLTDTVAELTRAAEQEESNLTRQAAALQQTQVTAQEIKQTSDVAAERAAAVLMVATRADELGQSGARSLAESMSGFQALRDQVNEMSEQIGGLNERAQRIGGITQTVKGLADRSNMLALNAAIEAVRSGEHGKGFGIVAKEIRTLANQSIQSTGQVGGLLEDITQAILKTVELSEQGQLRMEAGMVQARTSGESIHALTEIVQDNMNAVRQISGAVSQQNAGINEIFGALTDLSSLMHETMVGLQATQRVTQALREVAEQMQHVARSYRV